MSNSGRRMRGAIELRRAVRRFLEHCRSCSACDVGQAGQLRTSSCPIGRKLASAAGDADVRLRRR